MEKFFKPVHSPCSPDEIMKPRKHHHHHHHHHHHPQHDHHHHQDAQSQRYTMLDDTDRNTDESHGHHHQHPHHHGHYHHDSSHHNAQHCHQKHVQHSEEDEILYNHEAPVSRASSSSLFSSSSSSSSTSSSFSSWYTEGSVNDPFSQHHAEQPQHSLSCSNIADVRRAFREDNGSEPIVFATVKHGKKGSVCSEIQGSSHKRGKHGFSSLDRGHSRSDEGHLHGIESDLGGEQSCVPDMNYGPLYKTVSLNRSLAFSEEDILLGVSRGPKRAVSSSQLPSKGILKNKDPHTDIRKAKSMEVLSPRVPKGQHPSGEKGKGISPDQIEQARANLVQGKLQFSAFLDEITKQVISPSDLTILGMNKNKATGKMAAPARTPSPVKPQLPPKKHRETCVDERDQHPKQHSKPEKAARSSSRKHSDCSNPDKLISYAAKNHHGSPPPHHYPHSPGHITHHGSNHKHRRPSNNGGSVSGPRYVKSGPHLTDGTSTSPEPSQPKQRHHRKHQPTPNYGHHTPPFSQHQHQQPLPGPTTTPGLGSESSSSKSDSSRARDTASTGTSQSSEHRGRHHSQHTGHSKQRRDTLCDADHLKVLQEENADLQQNLLQTVVCIESLEAELQRTRDELSHVKEKYKSLLETHSGTKQANNLLGEHLHIASESLSSERKYLLNRVSQLSSELEDAHRTMAALENINVPCLIKELLEKHFDSAEALQKFLKTPAPNSHSVTSPHTGQLQSPKIEEAGHSWLKKSEAGPQRATAFLPFKQEVPAAGSEGSPGQQGPSCSPPFSVADISTSICKNLAASHAARPQPVYPQNQQQPQWAGEHTGSQPQLQQQGGRDSWGGQGGVKVTLLEQDAVDVTSLSAQQILDEFMQQLQAHTEAGGGKEQQGGQEWPGGAEYTGKVAE